MSRDREFRARDKKVHKMTRDGLIEQNQTAGTEERISRRPADVSFDKARPAQETTGRGAGRKQPPPRPKQGAKPAGFVERPPDILPPQERFADTVLTPDWEPESPLSMRGASDMPMSAPTPTAQPEVHAAPRLGKHRGRGKPSSDTKSTQRGTRYQAKFAEGAMPENPESKDTVTDAPPPVPHSTQEHERLHFDSVESLGDTQQDKPIRRGTQYQGKFAETNPLEALESAGTVTDAGPPAPHSTPERGRLRFDSTELFSDTPKDKTVRHGTRYQGKFTQKDSAEIPSETSRPEPSNGTAPERGRLRFDKAENAPGPTSDRTAAKKPQAAPFAADAAVSEGTGKLRYDKSELPPGERAVDARGAGRTTSQDTDTKGQTSGTSRQQKNFNKAERKIRTTDEKLEKAKSKLPTKRRVKLEKQYDSEAGKVRRRLQFEKEVIPQGTKPHIIKRGAKTLIAAAPKAAVLKAHQKMHEAEGENVAVNAAHKGEFAAERYISHKAKLLYRKHKNAPYERVAKLQRRQTKANVNLAYQQSLKDNPALQKKALAKWIQKQKIKRKYAQAAREAKNGVHHTGQVLNATGQIIRAIAQFVAAHKAVIGMVAAGVLIIVLMASGLSSCGAMLSGAGASIISTCYVADDKEINDSELFYTELETDLQKDIDDTEKTHPGFDEYRYNIGEISHSPYELMGYLSAAYGDFTFAEVRAEIQRLSDGQYTLTREEITEVRYRTETHTDADGNEYEVEVPYNWYVLQTTLTVKSLADIIQNSLQPGDQSDRYDVYMQTYGNRQSYGNPFSFPWLSYVTSPYGYRVHPITRQKDLHRGMDIGVAEGTPIQAIHDGRVISVGNAGEYGLCVVIEDDRGYQSRYAHCSGLSVSAGQEVKKGDVIAAVGSTGNSVGNHLHLEVTKNGEYLNPYYFVDTGSDGPGGAPGTAGGVDIPDNPGSPMGDGSYEAMLAEAQKHIGRPYVWGGSSPSTSFDCSGYVSWVINQSGVGSVGRQTAQGLFNLTTPVSRANAKPGDLIFFTGTYSSSNPVTHVGIYVGGGRMLHCGDPIGYANIDSNYWTKHFYSFGRI